MDISNTEVRSTLDHHTQSYFMVTAKKKIIRILSNEVSVPYNAGCNVRTLIQGRQGG